MSRVVWGVLGSVLVVGTMHQGWADTVERAEATLPAGIARLTVTQTKNHDDSASDQEGRASDDTVTSTMRVSMDFQDANLKDVLKAFSQQTGINVIAGADVADQSVTLYLEDVTVMDALDQILSAADLSYMRPSGSDIYIVRPKADVDGGTSTITRVYRLKYARVSESVLARAASAFGASTPFEAKAGVGTVGQGLGGGGRGGAEGVGIDTVIKELLTEKGDVVVDSRTNSLIISDVPENFPRLEAALIALDVRTAQIMVDAEVIETSLAKAKQFGVKWGQNGEVFNLQTAKKTTRFPFSQLFGDQGRASVTADTAITVGQVNANQVRAVLEALESDTDTKILARPKILTLDNESAIIRLTADEAIGITSSSQTTTGTVTAEPERETTGVVLVVTPQVNENGFITMLVEPSVTKTVASNLTVTSGTAPRDPKTRGLRTLVRIREGETFVVGGLIDRSEQARVSRVPVLSGIPFVGEAFKHTEINDSASEVIVFITPRVLEEPIPSQLAATPPISMGIREQEPAGARQDKIEQSLNSLE